MQDAVLWEGQHDQGPPHSVAHSQCVCVSLCITYMCRSGSRQHRCGARVRVRSLKVVVQRALIELPGSLRRRCSVEDREQEEEGDGGGRRRSRRVKRESSAKDQDEADSQLVTCQSCDITVHRGLSHVM